MPVEVSCTECHNVLKIPDEIFERRVRGRVARLTCKRCKASIEVDGRDPEERNAQGRPEPQLVSLTPPPPDVEPEVKPIPPNPVPALAPEAKPASPTPLPEVTPKKAAPAPRTALPAPRPRLGSGNDLGAPRPRLGSSGDLGAPRPRLGSSGDLGAPRPRLGSQPKVTATPKPLAATLSRPETPKVPLAFESKVKTLRPPPAKLGPLPPLPHMPPAMPAAAASSPFAAAPKPREAFESPPGDDDASPRSVPEVEPKTNHAAPAKSAPKPALRAAPRGKTDGELASLLGYVAAGFAAAVLIGGVIFGLSRCGHTTASPDEAPAVEQPRSNE